MPETPALALPYPSPGSAPDVPYDMQQLAEAIDDLIGGAWTAYTPTLAGSTSNPVLGSGGSTSGRYKQIGKTVTGYAVIMFGTSGVTPGGGNLTVGLPVPRAAATDGNAPIGTAFLIDVSTGSEFVRDLRTTGAMGRSAALVTSTAPVPWAANDQIAVHFTYEAA